MKLQSAILSTFDPVTTTAIRLNILDASNGPTITEVMLIQGK